MKVVKVNDAGISVRVKVSLKERIKLSPLSDDHHQIGLRLL